MAERERDCLPHKEDGFCSSDFCLAPYYHVDELQYFLAD